MSLAQNITVAFPDEIHATIRENGITNEPLVFVDIHDDEASRITILTTSVTYLAEAAHELLCAASALAEEQGLTFHDESKAARVELDHLLTWWRAVETLHDEEEYWGPSPDEGCQGFGCLGHLDH